jgi:hypothetical protein
MSETTENPTTPTATLNPPPPAAHEVPARGPGRLYQVVAWVGIVAGVVFIVAVVFFSGFFLGRHSGPALGHFGSHHGRGVYFFHHGGQPHMGPPMMGPRWGPPGGPQFGPSPGGPQGPSTSVSPSSPTTVPAVPR